MITAVCGGKGGTGKSTYALLLARRTGSLLVDTDVESSSLHLLMGVDVGEKVSDVFVGKPVLLKEKCKRCGICAQNCRFNAIFLDREGYPRFLYDLCERCAVCAEVCPFGAIKMEKEKVGEVYYNPGARLVTGKLMEGEARPIVQEMIAVARDISSDMILDCPAGIHCNVIGQMVEADRVIVVTEPTPLGFSGLKVAVETALEVGRKPDVVVNRYEPNGIYGKIEEFCREKGLKIVEKIEFSDDLARAYARGKLVDYLGGLE